MKAAVIGMGVVGQAQAAMLAPAYDLVTYDLADGKPYPGREIAGCDFAVVTVGTPAASDGSASLAAVRSAFAELPARLPVLLRSTVPPGTTARLQAGRPGDVCHAPEFLYEGGSGPWQKATDVPFLLLGGLPEARAFFRPLLERVFPGAIHCCSAVVAELAKYTANLHWALRVTYVNEMAGVAAAFGADWEAVREAWLQDSRVSPAHTAMAGFPPGFAGRCWPKDLSALIAAAEDADCKPEFLRAVAAANARFRGE